MTTSPHDDLTSLAPNHHADHPGFSGVSGLAFALFFSVGRTGDADLAIDLAGVGADDHVLDIGCGPGVAVRRAISSGAASAVGVDPSAEMLRVARATDALRRGRRADYRQGSAEQLPLDDDSVTIAWSLATVHHWHDLDAGLAEVRRVLRPGGRFLALERHVEAGATGAASHGWTPRQADGFAERCSEVGFTDLDVSCHTHGRRRVLTVIGTTT